MKILITGVAGFIGSKLASFLIQKKYIVYGVDNLWKGEIKNIPKNVKFIEGDVGSKETIKKILDLDGIDIICHLAGQSSGEKSFIDPLTDNQHNLLSTLGIIEICNFFRVKKIINASSMSIYGDLKNPANEKNDPPNPKSIYGQNKLSSEKYLSILLPNVPVLNFRMFNVYGPGQCLKDMKQGMVSIFIAMALNNQEIKVKGSLNRIRDFIYIDDVINFWYKAINLEFSSQINVNLGTGKGTKISKLINIIKDNLSNNLKIKLLDPTPCDQFQIYACNKKLLNLFGNYEFKDLKNGIEQFIHYAQRN